jgi:predicted protein tyrosine phosphatase
MSKSMERNRLWNADNKYQNFKEYPRLLTVCSAGALRSPTAAYVLSQDPFNYNTRSCGLDANFAIVPIDGVLISWARIIVVMSLSQKIQLQEFCELYEISLIDKDLYNFEIPDEYEFRDPALIKLIKNKAMDFGLSRNNK